MLCGRRSTVIPRIGGSGTRETESGIRCIHRGWRKGRELAGVGTFALGAAPVLGGALLAMVGGQLLSGFDYRAGIKEDFEILALLPDDETERRAALKQSIAERIDDLVEANAKRRELRAAALEYGGNWRDVVMFLSTVLFTVVWWNVDHDRTVWVPLFVALVVACIVAAVFAWRGVSSVVRRLRRRMRSSV